MGFFGRLAALWINRGLFEKRYIFFELVEDKKRQTKLIRRRAKYLQKFLAGKSDAVVVISCGKA